MTKLSHKWVAQLRSNVLFLGNTNEGHNRSFFKSIADVDNSYRVPGLGVLSRQKMNSLWGRVTAEAQY